ncbi:interleukin-20 receptor subunit alpha-like [Chiloscyllium plagiosum]|uniref:interleukin-20 receptor subunit alpha-like n=1 Tax=Chiloscyllium plagiosum TaxID=36176 RepID=UPI001CB855A9|nr:interleukin-20 receptor subunit alpha-like [Chiloscyllium plagiosum]
MAVQMFHIFLWFLQILILFNGTAMKEPKEPQDVKFVSQNFQNILHWKTRNETENIITYFVQHRLNGKPWLNKTDCWGIKETFCDLTQETNPFYEKFFARVRANSFNEFSNWTESEAFCPMTDTLIGPAETEVISFETSTLVKVIAPCTVLKKQSGSLKSVEDIYHKVKYDITVSVKAQDQIGSEQLRTYITNNKTFGIHHLSPGTTYCVSVQIRVPLYSMVGKPSKEQCETLTRPKTRIIHLVIICSACGALILVTLSIYLYFKYFNAPETQLPAMLTTWNRKELESAVFIPQIIESTNIAKWEFTKASKYPRLPLLQNRHEAHVQHCKKYINIESSGRFRNRDFDHNSTHQGTIIFYEYLEQPQFICSEYTQLDAEPDTSLYVDQQEENIRLQWTSPDCCQCHSKKEFQVLETGPFQKTTEISAPGYPDYVNEDLCENPILKNWGLIIQQMDIV